MALPSAALYWHMGETTMRLANFRPRKDKGENRTLLMGWGLPGVGCFTKEDYLER